MKQQQLNKFEQYITMKKVMFVCRRNSCRSQMAEGFGRTLGEGKIVDGCITCPWHGYQYLAHNGQSPPPFTEKIKTYKLKIMNNTVYINPEAFAEGTEVTPISC